MNIALWVVAVLLAGAFAAAGAGKLTMTRKQLAEKGMTYVEDFSDGQIKTIGALEVLGVIGLILPPLVGIMEFLAPLAATGLLATMAGAIVVHLRRKEPFVPALALGVLAAFVAVGRFWIAPF